MPNDLIDRRRFPRERPLIVRFWRATTEMRWRDRKTARILPPHKRRRLYFTHAPYYRANETLRFVGTRVYGKPPRVIRPWYNLFGITLIVIVGVKQHGWSGLPGAEFYAKLFGFRVILAETHEKGHVERVTDMLKRNDWMRTEVGDQPFYLLGSSKGGYVGLHWIDEQDLTEQCRHMICLSTPLRGTDMADVEDCEAAWEVHPRSPVVRATQEIAERLHAQGLPITSLGAMWDSLAPRSDCRLPNTNGYVPPPFPVLFWRRLRSLVTTGWWHNEPGEPWHWCITLPVFGHVSIYKATVWFIIAVSIVWIEIRTRLTGKRQRDPQTPL